MASLFIISISLANFLSLLSNYDSEAITIAFQYLKLHYRFMGILVIVILICYLAAIIVMLMAFPFVSSMMHR